MSYLDVPYTELEYRTNKTNEKTLRLVYENSNKLLFEENLEKENAASIYEKNLSSLASKISEV